MIDENLLRILACPACKKDVELKDGKLVCVGCSRTYRIEDGIPVMLVDEETKHEKDTGNSRSKS